MEVIETNLINIKSTTFKKGRIAKKMLKSVEENPYEVNSGNYWEWLRGYFSTEKEDE